MFRSKAQLELVAVAFAVLVLNIRFLWDRYFAVLLLRMSGVYRGDGNPEPHYYIAALCLSHRSHSIVEAVPIIKQLIFAIRYS